MKSGRQRNRPSSRRTGAVVRATPRQLRDALREQATSALAELEKPHPSDPEVHSARKSIKKARAMLRLMRDALGNEIYRRENEALRDAARPLSASRDSKVLLEAIDTLASKGDLDDAIVDTVRAALTREQARVQKRAAASKSLLTSRRLLRAVLRRATRWPIGSTGNSQLVRSGKRVYRRARRAFEAACEEKTAENLHEWRKHVKYLWHEMQFLETPRCPAIAELGSDLHKLSDDLGDDHDLAVLSEWVRRKRSLLDTRASKKFFAAVEKRQSRLQKAAFSRGRRVFADKPGKFADWLQQSTATVSPAMRRRESSSGIVTAFT
jgi:CHAD domain-containing protein